jgi:hypothetical protein
MVTLQPNGLDESLNLSFPRPKPQPNPLRYAGWQSALLVGNDVLVFAAAGALALLLTKTNPADIVARPDVVLALVFAAAIVLSIYDRLGLYRRSFSVSTRDEVYSSFAGSLLGLIPPVLLLILLPSLAPFRHWLALSVVFSAAGLSVSRLGLRVLRDRVAPPRPRRIAIAGRPERVDALPSQLSLSGRDSILRLPLERFDEELDQVVAHGDVSRLSWLEHATAWNCDTLLVTEALPAALITPLMRTLEARGVRLAFAPMRIRAHACDLEVRRDGSVALLYPQQLTICTPGADVLRRIFDLTFTVPALLLLAPVSDFSRSVWRSTRAGPCSSVRSAWGAMGKSSTFSSSAR